MSLLWPAQVAMVTAWKASAAVKALLGDPARIYDGQAPQGTPKPYVVVGEQTDTPRRLLGKGGGSDTITASVFSAYPGAKEVTAIAAVLDGVLVGPLVITGYGSARVKGEFATVLVEDDGVRHLPRRYRVTAFET